MRALCVLCSQCLAPYLALLVALLLATASPARANDSVAGLEAGELVMRQSDQIEMAEEELYLSRTQIRVRYLFRNHSDQALTTLVAFPLPPIQMGQDYAYGFTQAHGNPHDPVNFHLWIDSRPAPVKVDMRAVTPEGRDVTKLLQKLDIPLVFLAPDAASMDRLWARLDALPPQTIAYLRAAGAVLSEPGGEFAANWITHVRYYWSVTFPPGGEVEIRHAYTPVPEAFIFTRYDLENGPLRDEVCMDSAFRAGALARLGNSEYGATTGYLLRYILTTANSWRGPIGRFHLIVDKGSPDMLVSLCRNGIRKTGATTFEWRAENWAPTSDLSLLFLAPPR